MMCVKIQMKSKLRATGGAVLVERTSIWKLSRLDSAPEALGLDDVGMEE